MYTVGTISQSHMPTSLYTSYPHPPSLPPFPLRLPLTASAASRAEKVTKAQFCSAAICMARTSPYW